MQRCKKITLRERPPIPYVPEKDCVQEMVSAFKDQSLKTQIGKVTELLVPIWQFGTGKLFLICVGSALEAIQKKGYFKANKDVSKAYVEQCKPVKQTKEVLAKFDGTTSKGTGSSGKSSKKPK
jgi:hypothetical protein